MTAPRTVDLHEDIAQVLITEEQIATRVAELGERITAD
jgi:hypoxanthine-guanine phosphoribosyltransferase